LEPKKLITKAFLIDNIKKIKNWFFTILNYLKGKTDVAILNQSILSQSTNFFYFGRKQFAH